MDVRAATATDRAIDFALSKETMTSCLQELWDYCEIQNSSTALFEANLDVIEHAIAQVCRSVRLFGPDAEDFASSVRIALLADDCAILRKFEGRSSLGSYIAIVARRRFIDQKRTEGRWYASAEATRHGTATVLLERLLRHEGRTLAEAMEITMTQYPDTDRRSLEASANAIPERAPRPRLVPVIAGDEERFAGAAAADDLVTKLDLDQRSERISHAVQTALASMSQQDRVTLRLRFGKGLAISNIARALGIEQRPLYRRIESLLNVLRDTLEQAGIDASEAAELIGAPGERLDFGLASMTSGGILPSPETERR
jgi:RNA polymerase sigma factor (sigma-70 family)